MQSVRIDLSSPEQSGVLRLRSGGADGRDGSLTLEKLAVE
jgi:hypothetical protein